MTLGNLRNYYRNELDDVEVNNNASVMVKHLSIK